MNSVNSIHPSANKESVSSDKLRSLRGLIFGSRAMQFDALLKKAPTSGELTALAESLKKPEICHVIFDLDGTLVPPYAPVTGRTLKYLRDFQDEGRNVAIYSNSGFSDRIKRLMDDGIPVAATCAAKPSLRGFEMLCNKQKMNPAHTAMIGNFPITDMPLVKEGEPPYFPLNVLVESIPPQWELIGSLGRYCRARLFHTLNVWSAGIVRHRNPGLLKDVPGR